MKSGPTFAERTRCPAARSAASSPVATVVLPTPEWVPATTIRGPSDGITRSCQAAVAVPTVQRPMTTPVPPPGPHGGDAARVAAWLGRPVADAARPVGQPEPGGPGRRRRHRRRTSTPLGRYPDPAAATAALAAAIGVDPDLLVLTNGGAEAIALVAADRAGGRDRRAGVLAVPPAPRTGHGRRAALAIEPVEPRRPPRPARRDGAGLGRGVLPARRRGVDAAATPARGGSAR